MPSMIEMYILITKQTTLLLFLVGSAAGGTFLLEAEQYVKDRIAYPRTAASGIWAVHFYQDEVFPIEFCVQSNTTITVTDVRYSNDGGQDYVDVRLDGQRLDTFLSLAKTSSTDEWNQFDNSGQIGGPVEVLAGKHVLELAFVFTDRHGIEIDFVALDIAEEGQDKRMLQCMAYCDDTINYTHTLVSDSLPSGWLQQKSRRSACAEEQNVRIEVYHPGLRSYSLTAQPPVYKTLLDNRQQDFQHCTDSERHREALWFFNNFDLDTSADQMTHKTSSVLSFDGGNFTRNTRLTVQFSISNQIHTLPGAVLTLKLRRTASDVGTVTVLLAINRSDTEVAEERSTNPSSIQNEMSWTLNAEVLRGDVELVLTVVHHPFIMLHADYLRLEVQRAKEVSSEVYRDSMTLVQAITAPSDKVTEGMMLYRPDNRVSWYNIDVVTVLKKVSWSEDFEEIFRLDQQGMVWLKPRSSYASNSPPYGTTVVVGPSDPNSTFPEAKISHIDIDPWALKFTISYVDSSVSDILIRMGSFGVRAIVTHHQWATAVHAGPVAVVTSMWVADGKADVDHVNANGAEPHEVLSGWNRLYGINFAFFRQCVSKHNTQAPDITLDFLEPHPDLHIDLNAS